MKKRANNTINKQIFPLNPILTADVLPLGSRYKLNLSSGTRTSSYILVGVAGVNAPYAVTG